MRRNVGDQGLRSVRQTDHALALAFVELNSESPLPGPRQRPRRLRRIPQPVGRCVRRARGKRFSGAGPGGGGAALRLAESGRLDKCRTPDLPASLSSRAYQGCSPSSYVRSPEGAACVSSWEGAARSSVESLPGFVRCRHLTRWSSHS